MGRERKFCSAGGGRRAPVFSHRGGVKWQMAGVGNGLALKEIASLNAVGLAWLQAV